jgi:hypothetical protein
MVSCVTAPSSHADRIRRDVTSEAIRATIESADLRGRQGCWVRQTGASSSPDGFEALFDALERTLAEHALRPADVVRSRLTAATRAGRDAGSVARVRRLAVPFPCATSSYIDSTMFGGGDGVLLETLALRGAGDDKHAAEHRPSPPPWRVVATGDLAFFSGITSFAAAVDDQLGEMCDLVAAALSLAEGLVGRRVSPVAVQAYVDRAVDLAPLGDLAGRVGLPGVPLAIARCDGFSYPSKLVEVEIDATLA